MTNLLAKKENKFEIRFSNRSKLLIAITSALIGLFAWAFSSPLGATPDEDYHLVSIWCGQGERTDLCLPGSKAGQVSVPTALVVSANCFAFHPENSAACNLPQSSEFTTTSRSNADGGYPPIFYWTMSFLASSDIYLSVVAMRILNAVLFIALITATMLLSPRNIRFPVLGGILITAIPLGMFLIPSVNPSSWAIISAATLWGSLISYFRAEKKSRKWTLFAIAIFATLLGAGARSDSAVYSCLALTTAVILSWGEITKNVKALIPSLLIIPIAALFYLRSGQSSLATSAPVSHGLNLQLAISNLTELPGLWVGSFGTWGLGWLDTQMPAIVWVTTLAIFSGVVFVGLGRFNIQKVLVISILVFSITVIPLYVLVHDNISVGSGVQPRYIYPLLIMIAGVTLWGVNTAQVIFSRLQVFIVAISLAIANSLSLHTNIRRYVTGTDAGGFNLNKNVEWWWTNAPSPMLTWVIGSTSFLILMLVLANTIWNFATPSLKKNLIS